MATQGDFALIKYAVRGSTCYHERLVTGVSRAPHWVAQLTTDGDHHMECLDPGLNPDLDDVRILRHRGEIPPVILAWQIYPFTRPLTVA